MEPPPQINASKARTFYDLNNIFEGYIHLMDVDLNDIGEVQQELTSDRLLFFSR